MKEENKAIEAEVISWAKGELERQIKLLGTPIEGQELYDVLYSIQHTANIAKDFISGLDYVQCQ